MLPADFTFMHGIAISLVPLCWFSYNLILSLLGHESLNSRLLVVRHQWVTTMTRRDAKPFDAILLGHIIHSVAFFGSATLIVLAGVLSAFVSLEGLHKTMARLNFIHETSLELFSLQYGFLCLVLLVGFFSFTYALRKLIYAIALVGALPDASATKPANDKLINHTATVLSEALMTFNSGIRGYYYAVATLFLFISPWACILATVFATLVLLYRQMATATSRAIIDYVGVATSEHKKSESNQPPRA